MSSDVPFAWNPNAALGVMGGTFDPPHLGHLELARAARRELGLDGPDVQAMTEQLRRGLVAKAAPVRLEGEVEMISEDLFGKKSLLSVLPVGSLFGESYTCVKARRRTIAYQARTHCRVLLLDYDRILHACKLVCRFHHRMIENMVELIAEKNLALVEKLEVISRSTIREKLLTYLSRQAEAAGSRTFTIPMGRVALAEYLCADRSAMTRELAHMKAEGLIDYDKRNFTLLYKSAGWC